MTHIKTISPKSTSYKLSDQVKNILQDNGLSQVFNYTDYKYFKKSVQSAFNKAQAIAELFIQENQPQSDFNDYVF